MTAPHTPADSIAISSARLNDNMAALGQIGLTDAGMQRVAFSAFDIAGRDHVMGLMAAAGMSVRIDAAGNIIGRVEGSDGARPAIVSEGSASRHRNGVAHRHRARRRSV